MKTLLLLLTIPLFAHVPCKQWEVIDTTINGKVRQISYCHEWDNKAPCPEAKTITELRTQYIPAIQQVQPCDCPEVIDRRNDWAAGFVTAILMIIAFIGIKWIITGLVTVLIEIISRLRD